MEKYCITLEQAKRLQELGASSKLAIEPEYFWYKDPINIWDCLHRYYLLDAEALWTVGDSDGDKMPAYSVGELGGILPDSLIKGSDYFTLVCEKCDSYWIVSYRDTTEISSGYLIQPIYMHSEAEARGALLIHLLEEGLI